MPEAKRRAIRAGDTTRGLLLAIIGTGAIVFAVALSYLPPTPKSADASATQFSSARAMSVLGDLLRDGVPHPVGSSANALVRDRIVEQLRVIGYAPEIQRRFVCDEWGDCATVENIVTRLPSRESGQAVVLSAHYDSVAAGPGASDDGAGVASILEIARALWLSPVPRHSIILLITDGEELGLLGARAFIEGQPWAREVRAAVNLEARGTSGPSMMFETGSQNSWAMKLYDGRVAKPITNSLYYTAYKLLPNDTDFTVFKTSDWQGYNFAFTGDVMQYHTPLDDLAHVSPDSLQHHGDNALSTLLALASADLPEPAAKSGESVYVDLFAGGLLRWPAAAALPLALVVALLWFGSARLLIRRHLSSALALRRGMAGMLGALLLAVVVSMLLLFVLRAFGALPPSAAGYQWTAKPFPLEIANATWAITVLVLTASRLARRVGFWGLWLAAGGLLNVAGVLIALFLPGLSFALLLPCIALLPSVVPALLTEADRAWTRSLAAVVPSLIAVAAWLPTVWYVYQNLGLIVLPAVALLVVWMLLPTMALLARASRAARRGALVLALLSAITATVTAANQPVYTADSPLRLNFDYWLDAGSDKAEWLARPDSGVLPAAVKAAAPFARRKKPVLPWTRAGVWSAEAPKLELPGPIFEVQSAEPAGGKTRYRVYLASQRGASMASVCFAPDAGLSNVMVGGLALPAESAKVRSALESRRRGWRCLADYTMRDEAGGVMLEFDLTAKKPVELIVSDRSDGLPPSAAKLLDSRPANATPSQDGDTTRVFRRITLPTPPV